MNCEMVSERLPELLSGALDRQAEAETLAHLAACESCRRDLAFWAKIAEAAKAEAAEMPSEAFEQARENLFGPRTATLVETARIVGRALGLARSSVRLAMAAAGR